MGKGKKAKTSQEKLDEWIQRNRLILKNTKQGMEVYGVRPPFYLHINVDGDSHVIRIDKMS